MSKKLKASLLPVAKDAQTPKEKFERFVSALIRVPKKDVDEKELSTKPETKAG